MGGITIMDELLKEIINKLNSIDSKIDNLDTKVDSLETKVDSLETKVVNLEHGQKEIKESVHRIELSQPQDIVALLERMNKNLENKTEVLNKRVFNVETEIERLNRQ
jgi:vacuolar-type H+-ATPase subunit D/Vma8